MYENNVYRGGYGGPSGGSGLFGGGSYNGGFRCPRGGYGNQDPNDPFGAPPSPPGFWISFLRVMEGVVTFFGRIAMLIDQNTQAFHMFITALLQMFDRSGLLYGELARFVITLLGIGTKAKKAEPPGPDLPAGSHNPHGEEKHIEGPKPAPGGTWDSVWGDGAGK